jgi:hypothetical protein
MNGRIGFRSTESPDPRRWLINLTGRVRGLATAATRSRDSARS